MNIDKFPAIITRLVITNPIIAHSLAYNAYSNTLVILVSYFTGFSCNDSSPIFSNISLGFAVDFMIND